ncbi:MAG: hypothetical protein KJO02_02535 [Erythrobacter sp.]|nr:hypothetical protein [Erythrobacter sp.]
MGEYAPEDQRTIHENAGPDQSMSNWHDIEKSERQRQHEQQEEQSQQQGEAQRGYGNARNEDGQMEQDVATASHGEQPLAQGDSENSAQPGEISDRPDTRAAADANRPLGES